MTCVNSITNVVRKCSFVILLSPAMNPRSLETNNSLSRIVVTDCRWGSCLPRTAAPDANQYAWQGVFTMLQIHHAQFRCDQSLNLFTPTKYTKQIDRTIPSHRLCAGRERDTVARMETTHRKIELQSPADLTYLLANASTAARKRIDVHFPPNAAPEGAEDPMRRKVEELVDQVFSFPSEPPEAVNARLVMGRRDLADSMGVETVHTTDFHRGETKSEHQRYGSRANGRGITTTGAEW